MEENGNKFNVSQEFEIIPHQKGKAYPIGVGEWNHLKAKIKAISVDVNTFHTIGFSSLGACASCLITIFATDFKSNTSLYLIWSVFVVTLLTGLLSIYFSNDKHKQEIAKPKEIIDQMELIESRFENANH